MNPHKELDCLRSTLHLTKLHMCPTEYRKQFASKVEAQSDEQLTTSISTMMDHTLSTHRNSYAFVGKAISDYEKVKDWIEENTKPRVDEKSNRRKQKVWTQQEMTELKSFFDTTRIPSLTDVKIVLEEKDILQGRTAKGVIDNMAFKVFLLNIMNSCTHEAFIIATCPKVNS